MNERMKEYDIGIGDMTTTLYFFRLLAAMSSPLGRIAP